VRVIKTESCPVCGEREFLSFELGGDGTDLRRCERCHTVFAPDYYHPDEIYVDGYMFGQTGQFGPPDVRDPLFAEYLKQVARRRMSIIEGATGIRAGSVLDVGCGAGEVLLAAREQGWLVQGVEPERSGAELSRERGLPVEIAYLEESGIPERSFDVVSAFHVLEHVPDSRAFLRTLQRWAKPGGFVAIEVPNFKSIQRREHKERWMGYRPREHIVHFTPATLANVFESSGLEPTSVRTPAYVGPPQHLEHALDDLVRHGRFRRVVECFSPTDPDGSGIRRPNRAGWALLRAMEAFHDRAGVGSVVLCVGQVPR